jgi:hypothetical protein
MTAAGMIAYAGLPSGCIDPRGSLMKRLLLLIFLCAIAGFAVAQKPAAPGTKAYAPEELNKLTQPEQIRVLEKQYAEMSGGQSLPEDQLEFYLEQIPRGWTYAQITQDMAESLRDRVDGNTYPNNPPPGPAQTPGWVRPLPGRGQVITCESDRSAYRECATGFRNIPQVESQLSNVRCVEGRNWGHRPGMVWVQGGCRARFIESAPAVGRLPEITCQSVRGYRECNVAFRGAATLVRQVSGSSLCVEGRTWGQRPGVVWVDRGCAGIFSEGYRSSGGFYAADQYDDFTVDCSSVGNGYQLCSWDPDFGRPQLIEQYSLSPCIEGTSWGYSPRRGLWVDAGCRARFGGQTR